MKLKIKLVNKPHSFGKQFVFYAETGDGTMAVAERLVLHNLEPGRQINEEWWNDCDSWDLVPLHESLEKQLKELKLIEENPAQQQIDRWKEEARECLKESEDLREKLRDAGALLSQLEENYNKLQEQYRNKVLGLA